MTLTAPPTTSNATGPAWEIATLFPDQGEIDEGDYLWITRNVKRLVEFTDGRVEVLPVPTWSHQKILLFVYAALLGWVTPRDLGELVIAAFRVRIRRGKYREPDVAFMTKANLDRASNEYWSGADLVVEVVSPDNPERDLVEKRSDYAEAGIPEYWIVDPRAARVTVLRLVGGTYEVASEATTTGTVASSLLPGFSVDVAAVFAAGRVG